MIRIPSVKFIQKINHFSPWIVPLQFDPEDLKQKMFVQTGLDILIEKKIIWNIKHFNYFNGEIERFINQVTEVDLDEVQDVPQTKWKFDIQFKIDQEGHPGRPTVHKSIKFSYVPLNAGITRTDLGTTFHIVKAKIIKSDGITKWKSFQTELKDLMDPRLDGTSILIATLCKDSSLTELPLQLNKSLMIDIKLIICRKICSEGGGTRTNLQLTKLTHGGNQFVFGHFLNSEEHSDVKIIAKDGKEFHAHKIILRARCEVFEAMFRSNMVESHTGIVELDDIFSEGVNFLLHYLYNQDILPFTVKGNIVESKGGEKADAIDVEEVLKIASKYGLDFIKKFVECNLRRLCDDDNALYFLGLCEKYSLACLDTIQAFIKSRDQLIEELMSNYSQDYVRSNDGKGFRKL